MSVPNLSIVIPSHNRPDLLRQCLVSVSPHAPQNTQIVVVDDGSRDAAVSATAREFHGVQVVRNERARGFAIAANRGVATAQAPIIELLNDDTQVTAGWAGTAMSCFSDASIAAVAPLVLQGPGNANPPLIDSAGDDYDHGGFARKRGHGARLSASFAQQCEVFGA